MRFQPRGTTTARYIITQATITPPLSLFNPEPFRLEQFVPTRGDAVHSLGMSVFFPSTTLAIRIFEVHIRSKFGKSLSYITQTMEK